MFEIKNTDNMDIASSTVCMDCHEFCVVLASVEKEVDEDNDFDTNRENNIS